MNAENGAAESIAPWDRTLSIMAEEVKVGSSGNY